MKFITTRNEAGIEELFLFPRSIHHDAMAEVLEGIKDKTDGNWIREYRRPVAAGFVTASYCYGSSETLGLSARPEDTNLLRKQVL